MLMQHLGTLLLCVIMRRVKTFWMTSWVFWQPLMTPPDCELSCSRGLLDVERRRLHILWPRCVPRAKMQPWVHHSSSHPKAVNAAGRTNSSALSRETFAVATGFSAPQFAMPLLTNDLWLPPHCGDNSMGLY